LNCLGRIDESYDHQESRCETRRSFNQRAPQPSNDDTARAIVCGSFNAIVDVKFDY
jgi:hypothetical protein